MENETERKEISEELSEIEIQISSLLERQQYLLERKHELENHLKDTSKPSTSSTNVAQKRQNFAGANFAWSKEIEQARKDVFNIDSFRPLQLECMNATMSGCDCILIMPTGGGKSLCFQLPAVVSKGFTLVVSPLVSLMEDQLIALHRLGIKSEMLNASCSREKVNSVHAAMVDKKSGLKLLYVTPEKIAKSKRFMAKLEKGYEAGLLSRIVIDEVHCASQWGHDFRPDYKILGILKRQYPGVPILALTATATSKVIEDVKKILGLQSDCLLLKASFNRPNLFYEVRHKPPVTKDCLNDIHQLITTRFNKQSGIIYCFSRQDSEDVARELMTRGVKAACYHADMPSEARSQVHLNWTQNKIQVVVATIAFGMGIDKPDVRFVIHHSLSKSMENYYQESGRAGRDDKRSHCILYYRPFDAFRQLTMVFTEQTGIQNLYNILRYCQDETQCRRSLIGQYFGEAWDPQQCKGMCDHCLKSDDKPQPELTDITDYTINIIKILDQASSLGERVTPNKLLDAWKGKGQTSLRVRSVTPPKLSQDSCERLIVHLLFKGILKEEFHFTPYSTICYVVKGTRGDMVLRGLKVKMDIRDGDDDASKSKSACATKRKSSSSTSKKETKSHNGLPATDSTSKKRKKDVNTQEVELQTVDGGDKKPFVVLSDSDDDEDFVL